MAEKCFPTPQRLREFGIDAESWSRFITGNSHDINLNRDGVDIETIQKWRERVMDIARQAAEMQTYLTKARADAAQPQEIGATAQITNDSDPQNNGYWVSDGSQWVYSSLQPALRSSDQNSVLNRLDPGTLANALFFAGDINGHISLVPDSTHGFYYPITSSGAKPRTVWLAEGGELSLRESFDLIDKVLTLNVTVGKRTGTEFTAPVDFEVGIQFLDSSKNVISNEPIETLPQFSAATARFSWRFGLRFGLAGLDVTAPSAAHFGRPYIKVLAGTGLIVRSLYVSQEEPQMQLLSEKIHETTEQLANRGVIGFLDHHTTGGVWDFSASGTLRNLSATGVEIPTSNAPLEMGSWGGYRAWKASPAVNFGKPLLPAGASTLVMSFVPKTASRIALFDQTLPGQSGSVQIRANARLTNNWSQDVGNFGVFIRGCSGGKGYNGNPLQWQMHKGSPNVFTLVLDGANSCWRLNGQKIDDFSVPPEIYQGIAYVGNGELNSAFVGRMVCVPRALSEAEVSQVESWCADAFGMRLTPLVQPDASGVAVTARAAAAVLTEGGRVKQTLFAHNATQMLIPASMTKVCCALVAARNATPEMLDGSHVVEVLASDATSGSGNNLLTGDRVRFVDLFYNLMLPSSNVSATIISRVIGEQILKRERGEGEYSVGECQARFIAKMNEDARSLGAHMTHFTTPSGLLSSNRSTALDMLKIAAEFTYSEFLRGVWSTMEYSFSVQGSNAREISLVNTAGEEAGFAPDLLGGKTGSLTGGWNNFIGEYSGSNGSTVLMIVAGSSSAKQRFVDCRAMKTFIQESFSWPVSKLSAIPT